MTTNSSNSTNLCPRCGKPRIDGKTWKEEVTTMAGVSIVTHIQTICSDPKCQKLVEERLAAEKVKSDEIKKAFDQRAADKKIEREKTKLAKAKTLSKKK